MTQIVVDIEAAAEAIYEAGQGERWYPNPGDTWATLPDGPLAQKIRHEARRVVEAALPERCWCGGTLLDSAGGEGLACERDSSRRPTEQGWVGRVAARRPRDVHVGSDDSVRHPRCPRPLEVPVTAPGVSPRSDEEAAHIVYNSRCVLDSRTYPPDEAWVQLQAAAEALLVEREDQDRRIEAVEAIRQDILSEMPPEEWGRSAWWDAMDSVEKELRRALGDPPLSTAEAERDALAAENEKLRGSADAWWAEYDKQLSENTALAAQVRAVRKAIEKLREEERQSAMVQGESPRPNDYSEGHYTGHRRGILTAVEAVVAALAAAAQPRVPPQTFADQLAEYSRRAALAKFGTVPPTGAPDE